MALPAALQRRIDAEAGAFARAFADPHVPDPVLRAAVHRFADAVAPALVQPAPPAPLQPAVVLGGAALALAAIAFVAITLPLAAVPLLVVSAVALLSVAWASAARRDVPSLDELRAALRSAAYADVLARRAASDPTEHRIAPRVALDASPSTGSSTRPDHAALQGRATYAAAAALGADDTATVIDL